MKQSKPKPRGARRCSAANSAIIGSSIVSNAAIPRPSGMAGFKLHGTMAPKPLSPIQATRLPSPSTSSPFLSCMPLASVAFINECRNARRSADLACGLQL